MMRIVASTGYARRVRKLLTAHERQAAELSIAFAPEAWPVVAGTGGCRKARVGRGGRGKRGGARIIYFAWLNGRELYLLDIYAKNEKEDLRHADKEALRRTVEALARGG